MLLNDQIWSPSSRPDSISARTNTLAAYICKIGAKGLILSGKDETTFNPDQLSCSVGPNGVFGSRIIALRASIQHKLYANQQK